MDRRVDVAVREGAVQLQVNGGQFGFVRSSARAPQRGARGDELTKSRKIPPEKCILPLFFRYQKGLAALVHALPSAMWYFPRAGLNRSTSWSRADAVVQTPTKNYSAFDVADIFADLGLSADQQAELAFLSTEPDLSAFAAPGVRTFVTYGTGFPSTTGERAPQQQSRVADQ